MIKGYHTDNGIFQCLRVYGGAVEEQQKIMFSGAGGSYQNGSEERVKLMVVTMAGIMLVHAALRCPKEKLSTDLWPIAMYYNVWI